MSVRRVGNPDGPHRSQAADLQRAQALPARRSERRRTAACFRAPTARRRSARTCSPCTRSRTRSGICTGSGRGADGVLRPADDREGGDAPRRRSPRRRRRRPTTRSRGFYPHVPDEYRSAACGNGGPRDLRPTDPRLALVDRDLRRDVRDLPVGDLLRDLLHLLHVRLRHLGADLAEADAVVLEAEDGVRCRRRTCRRAPAGSSSRRRCRRASSHSSAPAGRDRTGRRRRRSPTRPAPSLRRARRARSRRRPGRRCPHRRRSGSARPSCTSPDRPSRSSTRSGA